jgi:hypothetical protein
MKKSRKFMREFAGSAQSPKKLIGTPNKLFKTSFSQKKTMFNTLKVKRSQKFVFVKSGGILPGASYATQV